MPLVRDLYALEALPLRLLIIAIVAGLSIMPAADVLESLRDRSFIQRCELQLDTMMRTAQAISIEGLGAVRTVHLDFTSDGRLQMASLTVGDEWGKPCMTSIVLELSSGGRMVRTAMQPAIWLTSEGRDGLCIMAEAFDLRLEVASYDSVPTIVCEALPWTS